MSKPLKTLKNISGFNDSLREEKTENSSGDTVGRALGETIQQLSKEEETES